MANLIPNKGNYRELLCYRKAKTIYDITYFFTTHFLERGDRTVDQMVQAARSGKQNIIEGYAASATSFETELKLLNVAKSSLQELLADYEDFLRTRDLAKWESDSEKFLSAQKLGKKHNETSFWMDIIRTRDAETIANLAIILIYQTDYLLYKFLQALSVRFAREGGFRNKLTRARAQERNKKNP